MKIHYMYLQRQRLCLSSELEGKNFENYSSLIYFWYFSINKLAPKPRKILQLLRLRQLHSGVFVKVNKATLNMLQVVQPFVTYG